ncbi:MAG TPA: hypothetical protein VMC79_00915, partial [Rectinemataceae bacterium]|nr:hypothetical protein [Rectinemataceae bacterium]
ACADQERYLYRLVKTRGTAAFGPSEASLGVASATCQDAYEPNDSEASATPLDFEKLANLYYYASTFQQDGTVLTVQDRDWYAVTVPPRSTAEVLITESTLSPGTQTTHIRFYQKGLGPQAVNQSVPIDVVNSSYTTQTFLCELFPDPAQFQTAGGMVIGYSIKVSAIIAN